MQPTKASQRRPNAAGKSAMLLKTFLEMVTENVPLAMSASLTMPVSTPNTVLNR